MILKLGVLDKSVLRNDTEIYMKLLTKRGFTKGFTLVELLIVIGLLGAIALIVISAINPIEQSNKARDARFKADASQMISAIERFYASNSKFPWEACSGCTATAEDAVDFITASDTSIGLCGSSGCATGGILVTSNELKTEFLTRDWVKAATGDKQILIGKDQGSSSSVYACFVPLAKSTKDTAIADASVRTNSFTGDGIPSAGSCTTSTEKWFDNSCFVCIP